MVRKAANARRPEHQGLTQRIQDHHPEHERPEEWCSGPTTAQLEEELLPLRIATQRRNHVPRHGPTQPDGDGSTKRPILPWCSKAGNLRLCSRCVCAEPGIQTAGDNTATWTCSRRLS